MGILSKIRRASWRTSVITGDAAAVQASVREGSPVPVLKRVGRKTISRTSGRATRRFMRGIGL